MTRIMTKYTGIWPVAPTPFHDDGTDYHAGRIDAAVAGYARILPAVNHENRQCGWRSCKTAMVEGGVVCSEYCRLPIEPLHPEIRSRLISLLRPLDSLVLCWGH